MFFVDLFEVIENIVEIVKCCVFVIYCCDLILLKFVDDEVVELCCIVNEGLQKCFVVIFYVVMVEEYQEWFDFELGIIEGMGFSGYFLIVVDFI